MPFTSEAARRLEGSGFTVFRREKRAGQAKSAGKEFRTRLIPDPDLGYSGPCFGVSYFESPMVIVSGLE